jgi:hypothetical protein
MADHQVLHLGAHPINIPHNHNDDVEMVNAKEVLKILEAEHKEVLELFEAEHKVALDVLVAERKVALDVLVVELQAQRQERRGEQRKCHADHQQALLVLTIMIVMTIVVMIIVMIIIVVMILGFIVGRGY